MEIQEVFPHGRAGKTCFVAAWKPVVSALFCRQLLCQVVHVPSIMLQGLAPFRIDSVHLSLSRIFTEVGTYKELWKTIECLLKGIVAALKVVVSVSQRGECVVVPSILFDELGVLIFSWVLFCALEKHVLQKVSNAHRVFGIKGWTNVYVDGCSS